MGKFARGLPGTAFSFLPPFPAPQAELREKGRKTVEDSGIPCPLPLPEREKGLIGDPLYGKMRVAK